MRVKFWGQSLKWLPTIVDSHLYIFRIVRTVLLYILVKNLRETCVSQCQCKFILFHGNITSVIQPVPKITVLRIIDSQSAHGIMHYTIIITRRFLPHTCDQINGSVEEKYNHKYLQPLSVDGIFSRRRGRETETECRKRATS